MGSILNVVLGLIVKDVLDYISEKLQAYNKNKQNIKKVAEAMDEAKKTNSTKPVEDLINKS